MSSLEDLVFYQLLTFYEHKKSVLFHSGHPPSGKTYIGSSIRIPKFDRNKRTRDRYHLDFILQVGPVLILQELKGAASELNDDVEKLRTILHMYTLAELKALLARRISHPEVLNDLQFMIPSVGYSVCDSELPEDFLQAVVRNSSVEIIIGQKIPAVVKLIFNEAFR